MLSGVFVRPAWAAWVDTGKGRVSSKENQWLGQTILSRSMMNVSLSRFMVVGLYLAHIQHLLLRFCSDLRHCNRKKDTPFPVDV